MAGNGKAEKRVRINQAPHVQRPPRNQKQPAAEIFIELNAGSGTLTAAVVLRGINTAPPNGPRTGGTDLTNTAQVEALWNSWMELREQGYHLIIHWAPRAAPCPEPGNVANAPQTATQRAPGASLAS